MQPRCPLIRANFIGRKSQSSVANHKGRSGDQYGIPTALGLLHLQLKRMNVLRSKKSTASSLTLKKKKKKTLKIFIPSRILLNSPASTGLKMGIPEAGMSPLGRVGSTRGRGFLTFLVSDLEEQGQR